MAKRKAESAAAKPQKKGKTVVETTTTTTTTKITKVEAETKLSVQAEFDENLFQSEKKYHDEYVSSGP